MNIENDNKINARAIEILILNYDEIDVEEETREHIDRITPMITICGICFVASKVLEEIDSDAFNQILADYSADQEADGEWFTPNNGKSYYLYSDYEDAQSNATRDVLEVI